MAQPVLDARGRGQQDNEWERPNFIWERFGSAASDKSGSTPAAAAKQTDNRAAASAAGWVLGTTNAWTEKYFDPDDLHYADRELFGKQG